MVMRALLSAAMLLLLCGTGSSVPEAKNTPFMLVVDLSVNGIPPLTISTYTAYRGILIGAMNRLMATNADFQFTYTEDPNYGPFLQSVNGVLASNKDGTYWLLQVKTPDGKIITPNVGIGCYIPNPKEHVILKFVKG